MAARFGADDLDPRKERGVTNSSSAEKLLAVLGRVLKDATAHECTAILVLDEGSGIRFQTETGASLAFLPANQIPWQDAMAVFTMLGEDATKSGFPGCVVIDKSESLVTLRLAENAPYLRRATGARG